MNFTRRKILFLSLIFAFTVSSQASADVAVNAANFPDAVFREYVTENFDTDSDGTLTDSELSAVTSIDVGGKAIARLNGVQYFTALEVLSCDNNNLSHIDLSKNTALTALDCSHNLLTRLDVSSSPNLAKLICNYNNITIFNVSGTSLTALNFDGNFLLNKTITTNIYARNCTHLTSVTFASGSVKSIDTLDLSGCTALNTFSYVSSLTITNINFSGCTALRDLSKLGSMKIKTLNISGCTALENLNCANNDLTELDVSGCTALTTLNCSQNSLTMLDLSGNSALTSLTCGDQNETEQKVSSTGESTYPYQFDFNNLIPDNISSISGDSVQGITSNGTEIETSYADGVAKFKYLPYEIYYEFVTGYSNINLQVTLKAIIGTNGTSATAPVIMSSSLVDGVIGINYSVALNASGTRPMTWSADISTLPDGLEFLSDGVIQGTPATAGDYVIAVTAENAGGTASANLSLTVGESKIMIAPEITTTSLKDGTEGVSYGYILKADGVKPLKWSLASGDLPNGFELSENGQISGIATESGDFDFTVQAQNAAGTDTQEFTLTIDEAPADTKPVITTTELEPVIVGKEYNFRLSATGTPDITWSITNIKKLPTGLSFSSDGSFSGTVAKASKAILTFKAANDFGSVTKNLTIQCYTAPEINLNSIKDAKVGKKYSAAMKAKGSKPVKWTLEGSLPQGFNFDTNIGRITGTPTVSGAYNLRVSLTNAVAQEVKDFTFNVTATAPKISTPRLSTGIAGKVYKYTVKASGTSPLSYALDGYLPEGLSLDTGTGTIYGTPAEDCTDRKLVLTVSNMAGYDTKEFYFNVKGIQPNITLRAMPEGVLNSEYSAEVTYTGTEPVILSASGLPEGLTFVDGVISGIPAESGTFNVNITAENNADSVTRKYKLTVASPPSFKDDATLTAATAGKNYNYKFSADGSKKITFSLTEGTLPTGMSLNPMGAIKGKPSLAETAVFTITATNSYGSASKQFSLTVNAIPPTITGSMKKGRVGQKYNASLKVKGTAPISWTIDSDLPNGLEFRDGTFSGTPTEEFDGYITVGAVNSGGMDSKSYRLVIAARKGSTKTTSNYAPELAENVNVKAPEETSKEDVNNILPKHVKPEGEIHFGEHDRSRALIKIPDNYEIASVLPEIFVTESGFYEFEAVIDENIPAGSELIYLAFPQNAEPSEDDKIAEFYDADGKEISTVPENHKITVGAWFNENVVYAPVIAIKK